MNTLGPRSGACFCGAVRFHVAGTASFVCVCHCVSCRRATGGAMVTWATFPKRSFVVVDGALESIRTSPGVTRGHCAKCGSTISYENAARPEEIDITVAGLVDSYDLKPTAHIWVEDKIPWLVIADGLPQYARTVDEAPNP